MLLCRNRQEYGDPVPSNVSIDRDQAVVSHKGWLCFLLCHHCMVSISWYDRFWEVSKCQKKQTTKFMSANFQKMFVTSYIILRIHGLEGNSVDSDEAAHYELPHSDLLCCKKQLFSFLVLSALNITQRT